MNAVSSAAPQRSLSDFFYHPADKPIGPMPGIEYAYVRPELREEFLEYLHEQERTGRAEEMRAGRMPGALTAKLTPDQIQQLKAKYDPHNMTQEEYTGFVQDLIDFGVLTDDHTPYLECSAGISYTPLFHTVGGSSGPCGPHHLAEANGDAMEWVKTESLFRHYDEKTGTRYPGRKAVAFSKVHSAMQQVIAAPSKPNAQNKADGTADGNAAARSGTAAEQPKQAFREMLKDAVTKAGAQAHQEYLAQLTNPASKRVRLTAEQKKYLSETYRSDSMTEEEFAAFAEDLYRFGILTDDDKGMLGLGERDNPSASRSFADCQGNVLAWTKQQSATESFDPQSGKFYHGSKSILFARLYSVLRQF